VDEEGRVGERLVVDDGEQGARVPEEGLAALRVLKLPSSDCSSTIRSLSRPTGMESSVGFVSFWQKVSSSE
jgi:hypothetical protein